MPLTVFAEAAMPLPIAVSAVAATAPSSKDRVRVILLIICLHSVMSSDRAHIGRARSSIARTVTRTVETPRTFSIDAQHGLAADATPEEGFERSGRFVP